VTQTLVTSGTMTNRVDRLTARGLVERLPDPRDRRGVIVRLTPAGRSTVDDALAGLLAREHELLADLDAHERSELSTLLRRLVLPFEPR
jgi:DNA-binding MarR family transcriptional regulator